MAKILDKFFNRKIEGKLVADSGDELPKELASVSAVDNGKALVVSGGKWQVGSVGGGTKLYKHSISGSAGTLVSVIINNSNEEINTFGKLQQALTDCIVAKTMGGEPVLFAYDDLITGYLVAYIKKSDTPVAPSFAVTSPIPYEYFNITDTITAL